MDAKTFLGLEPTHNPNRWILPVTPGISTTGNFLCGGCGLGAAIEAMEGTTGRPVVWATAQYLSYANPPSIMDIDVTVAVAGNSVTQARAVGHVGDREILTVNAALGHRDVEADGSWATMPDVPAPERLPAPRFARRRRHDHGAASTSASPTPAAGRRSTATRRRRRTVGARCGPACPSVLEMSAAALAILGDYVPFGIGQALGRHAGGNSLDNTLRMVRVVPTEWVLLDIQVHAIANGFGHGTRAPLGRGRHAAGHRQPVDHRPLPRGLIGSCARGVDGC